MRMVSMKKIIVALRTAMERCIRREISSLEEMRRHSLYLRIDAHPVECRIVEVKRKGRDRHDMVVCLTIPRLPGVVEFTSHEEE
jgi:hypothetical protein